jgi:NAD-dependent protein deacetylase/lipoamidase
MKKLVVLTGAGISAESGIPTFRDAGGLWEGYDVMEVASPEGWLRNPRMVLDFYNQRRKKALEVKPNRGHEILAKLENYFDVTVVTQNIDNLHEQAGSTKVIHLHGSLFQSRSTLDDRLIYPIEGWELNYGELCEKGSQLRPHIVWFGEAVPLMDQAMMEASAADIFLIVGTSLQVYPAAGLIHFVPVNARKFLVDPNVTGAGDDGVTIVKEKASTGLEKVQRALVSG